MKNLKKNFSSKVVPVGLDFANFKDIAMVAMHISKVFCKIMSVKNFRRWIHTTTIVAIFIPSCE